MAIKQYKIETKTFYEIYVSHRSTNNPSIRAQRRKKGIETKGKAERLEKELLVECLDEVKEKEGRGDKWSQIVEKYKDYQLAFCKVQEDTIEDYVAMMRIWACNFWNKQISEITRADVRASIEGAKKAGKSNSHLRKLLHTIGRVHKWAKDEGLCSPHLGSISSGIVISKVEERAPKILSWEQLQYFISKAYELDNPWKDIWATAIHTGMRSGELFALKWGNVDLDKKTILVDESFNRRKNKFKSTKSGQFRTVPINETLFGIMVRLKNDSSSEFVLPRLPLWVIGHQAKCIQSFCSEIGLPLITFHTLRACFATHALSRGVPLGQVMKCAGWAELKTVQKYNRLAGVNEKGATDCLNGLSPVQGDVNLLKIGG